MAPTIFRRCGVRSLVLCLGAVYFLVMYVIHSGLQLQQSSGGPAARPQEEWDQMEIGADAFLSYKPLPIAKRNLDHQGAFDNIRRVELMVPSPKESLETQQPSYRQDLENPVVAKPSKWNRTRDVPDTFPHSFNIANIPSHCQDLGSDLEFRFQQVAGQVFVYSAFWDTRPNDFDNRRNGSYIRIIAIVRNNARPDLDCVFNTNPESDASAITSSINYYEMCENHGRIFGGYILSCPVPNSVTGPLCSITIVKAGAGSGEEGKVQLRIRTLEPVSERHDFSICVPPLFGTISPERLVEFLELSQILGAKHVTLYDFQLSPELDSVIDYYARKRKFVNVIPWKLDRWVDEAIWYHGQLVSIQDCLYRSMATSTYVAFNDIDEFMVPQSVKLWSDMVRIIDKPKRCAFQFKSVFFKPVGDESNSDNRRDRVGNLDLQTMVFFQRTSNFDRVRTKCMVKAYSIFEKGIHHVSKPIWADLEVHPVETEVARLHHYRVCLHGMGMNCATYEEDRTMLRYEDDLVAAANWTKHSSGQ